MSEQSNRDELIELLVPIVEPLVERQGKVEQGLQEQEAVLVELAGQLETLLKKSKEPEPSPGTSIKANPRKTLSCWRRSMHGCRGSIPRMGLGKAPM
ncbi:hypothetical protein [Glutamicibacter ardleyensis]|uniref:hypothetical protein n=1 Tax=Glutamicibacter ardleyensis TaxID=225894 RepID=UPI003FD2CBF4